MGFVEGELLLNRLMGRLRLRIPQPAIAGEVVSAGLIGVKDMPRITFEMTEGLAVMRILRNSTPQGAFPASLSQ